MAHQNPLVTAILRHGQTLAAADGIGVNGVFPVDSNANQLLVEDPFAFLVGVIVDYQMPAERAWSLPYRRKPRLGSWRPGYVAANPQDVHDTFQRAPNLHRFATQTSRFVVAGPQRTSRFAMEVIKQWNSAVTELS